ncbi:MAG TPA: hypothetical protein VFX49_15320 [Chloroflexota bacterium]|nr:hypothetical protein [Chloroflexota bacterium]
MVFVAHAVAGVHRIPGEWLDGYRPSGFRLAAPTEIEAWHEERGLLAPRANAVLFCAQCIRSVGLAEARERVFHEECDSGEVDIRLYSCAACGLDLAAEIDPAPSTGEG